MAKRTKKETIDRITKTDALDIQVLEISKNEKESKKQSLQTEFNRVVSAFIKEQRDVILVAVKVK